METSQSSAFDSYENDSGILVMNLDTWKQANRIFSELVDLPAKLAFEKLKTIENIQPEVKQLIITLIHSGNQSSQYFENNIESEYKNHSSNTSNWQAGDTIGDYQLIKEIGFGGMSKVFSGKRLHADVQKSVAIKIFSPKTASSQLLEHFIAEQNILSDLTHANIITMHHGETQQNGDSFIVMELIENAIALDEFVKIKKLSLNERIEMVLKIAHALAYAHSNLIIHRDIKPSNIIIAEDGTLKVVDFGIAKLITTDKEHDQTTLMALTPSFASPEQINAEKVTVSTDIFSLAAVCISLITEQNPFPENRLLKACQDDEEHLRTLLKKHPLDKDLYNILNKALQFDPNKRYNTMDKFAEDLQAWMNKKPVSATADSWLYRLSKFSKRRRALFASIMTLITSMSLAIVALSWQYNKTLIESQKAQQVKQFMLDSFNVTDPNIRQGIDISAKDLLKLAGDKLADNPQLDDATKFELYQTFGIAYGKLGFFQIAINKLKTSLKIRSNDSKSLSYLAQYLFAAGQQQPLETLLNRVDENQFTNTADTIRIYRVKSRKLAQNGDFKAALSLIDKLNKITDQSIESMKNKRLLAEIHFLMSDYKAAIGLLNALQKNSKLKATNTLSLGINNDLMRYYNAAGDYDSALSINKKIIAQQRLILGDRHPELADSLSQLSAIYRLKGDLTQATVAAEEAYEIYKNLYGEDSNSVAEILSKLAMLSYHNVNIPKATEQFSQAINIREKIFPKDHLETLKAKANFAGFLTATGKRQQAKEILNQVYNIQVQKLGATHLSTLATQQHLARTLAALGELPEAIKHAEQSAKYAAENYDSQQPAVQSANYILAKIYFKAKKYQQSLQIFLSMEARFKQQNNHEYATLLWDIAKIYVKSEHYIQADEYYLKSIQAYQQSYSPTHIRSLRIQLIYAAFLKSQNNWKKAQEITNKVQQIYTEEGINEPRLLKMIEKLKLKPTQSHPKTS